MPSDKAFPNAVRRFPPQVEWLQIWSTLFRSVFAAVCSTRIPVWRRHSGTFANYCGYVRTGCLLLGVDADVFDAPEIARAKRAIAARGLFTARPKMWIRREVLEKIVDWCDERPSFKEYGMLYLAAYAFLLRLPSEALPMRSASPEVPDGQSVLRSEGDRVVLTLARRKNRPHKTQLVRTCWCKESKKTCPVHRLGPWLGATPAGGALFPGVTAARALGKLRDVLWLLGPECMPM